MGALQFPSCRHISCLLFLLLAMLVLALSYFWMATGVCTQQDILSAMHLAPVLTHSKNAS